MLEISRKESRVIDERDRRDHQVHRPNPDSQTKESTVFHGCRPIKCNYRYDTVVLYVILEAAISSDLTLQVTRLLRVSEPTPGLLLKRHDRGTRHLGRHGLKAFAESIRLTTHLPLEESDVIRVEDEHPGSRRL